MAGDLIAPDGLPSADRLARAAAEQAVGRAGLEPQCRQTQLYLAALLARQSERRLDGIRRDRSRGRARLGCPGCREGLQALLRFLVPLVRRSLVPLDGQLLLASTPTPRS